MKRLYFKNINTFYRQNENPIEMCYVQNCAVPDLMVFNNPCYQYNKVVEQ